LNDGWGRDEIVGEGVVEVALELEDVVDLFELLLVSACAALLVYSRMYPDLSTLSSPPIAAILLRSPPPLASNFICNG
jgi:hypothetical protein